MRGDSTLRRSYNDGTFQPPGTNLNRCFVALRIAACAACLLANPTTRAAAPDDAMQAALRHLVRSQNLEQTWPAMLQATKGTGVEQIRKGVRDALDAGTTDPGTRARVEAAMARVAPAMTADIDAAHDRMDVAALMQDMVGAVYPKYYSAAEIEALSTFYESTVFRKIIAFAPLAQREAQATGQNPALVWARYEARLTPADKQYLAAFRASPVGRKQAAVQARVTQDGLRYLQERVAPVLDEIVGRYVRKVQQELQTAPAD
jgi:hypothetical protein